MVQTHLHLRKLTHSSYHLEMEGDREGEVVEVPEGPLTEYIEHIIAWDAYVDEHGGAYYDTVGERLNAERARLHKRVLEATIAAAGRPLSQATQHAIANQISEYAERMADEARANRLQRGVTKLAIRSPQDTNALNSIYDFLVQLEVDAIGHSAFPPYHVFYEGFTDACYDDAAERQLSCDVVLYELTQEWRAALRRETGEEVVEVDAGWIGDIAYGIYLVGTENAT